ncbi:cysteine-rich receptor-like protein kinase 2 [Zingiber officinale]|uniref:cysteine-rich receptor-like protein kinase 2 n=1 Tax=Zingiber officinale TaxID=94328 RepID=UPI001C4B1320|nr:cysteine-rich receptor-like protein kinase 2 [Zingiber officinale]XP_042438597.1 cysteine-rich receptor-like protein kinase 2 [Zingiber officinale]XP_042438598.1 cysteine-rich receptor-like protein kinase 2 [Zingiber officinale]
MGGIVSIVHLLLLVLLCGHSKGDPRSQTVEVTCSRQLEHNSTAFVPNFLAVMDSIGSQIRSDGFGMATVGSGPDADYGLSQCYGDLSSLDCVLCYAEARTVLPKCFPNTGGRIYLDGCFMRSENYSFFSEYIGPEDRAICGNKTSKGRTFEQAARQGLLEAVNKAPGNGGYAKISVPKTKGSNHSAYVLANCWRTLNETTCKACLENASASAVLCLPWSEGRVLNTGCFLRYSDTNFLNPDKSGSHQRRSIIAMVVAVGSALIVVVVGILVAVRVWKQRKLKKRRGLNNSVSIEAGLYNNSLNFKYSTLEKATGGFSDSNKLGQGGFGTVYKGTLVDGREIAVKRLFFNNKHRIADFYNEVNIINSVEHKNLARLLGCSCSGPESLLVYEFLPNKSLDGFLFDPEKGKELNWQRRLGIITGTAEGLSYLHQDSKIKIIHRDIKASNILLDIKFRPKIADFGLARTFQDDKSHISTAVAGTLGYMAPEYLAHGQLTEKADVFSFGVLMIELVTGKSNNRSKIDECFSESSESLLTQAWKHFQSGTIDEMIDPNILLGNYQDIDTVKEEILRVFHVGLLCTQESPSLRPLVSIALRMLCTDRELPAPTKPPFTDETTMELDETKDVECHPSPYSIASVSTGSFYPR